MSTEEERLLKEAKKLPWDERLFHKNWKVRNEANIDLAAACDSIIDPKDPRLKSLVTSDPLFLINKILLGPLFKKTVADSNAPVQEKALDALIAFLRAADADAGRYAKEVCDAIVAKCLTGRPKTVEKSQAAFLLWVELEAADAFLESMEKAIKNKVAKAVVPAIDVMFQALSEFGTKIVPPKRILKMLPELFDHQDQNVRASSKGLTLELCRWIGKEPVKSILFEKMRDTMKKELEAELANVTGAAKPTRKIRSEQDKEPEQDSVGEVSGSGTCDERWPMEIDEYELVDPVDILTPLERSGFWDGVLVTDVNLAVSIEAIQAIGNLARGLRTNFSGSSRLLLPVLLEKLKEKKPTLTDALIQSLQAMHRAGCLTLADCLNDGTPEVRDASFAALAAIAKMVGMRPLERSLEKLDDVRKKKLSEMIGDGTLHSITGSAPISTSGCPASGCEGADSSFVKRSAASMLSGKRPVQAAPTTKKVGPTKAGIVKKSDGAAHLKLICSHKYCPPFLFVLLQPGEMSLEEIEQRLGSTVKTETLSQLKVLCGKSVLKVQQQVIEVITYVASNVKISQKCVVLCLQAVGPGFIFDRLYKIMKEHKNPKVLSEGILWMVSALEDFGTSHVKLKDLIDFAKRLDCNLVLLQRENSTIKLIGVLHRFVGPGKIGIRDSINKLQKKLINIQPAGTGMPCFHISKGRLCDSNKNLVMATLATLGGIASAMGPAVEKSSKVIFYVLNVLGDNKNTLRMLEYVRFMGWCVLLDRGSIFNSCLADQKLGADGLHSNFIFSGTSIWAALHNVLLRALVSVQSGHNIEKVREKMRELLEADGQ
ncbi:hypothetical protein HPP92_017462 [Vanilla planifolia]|uniref:TOG domain-containing protein n=1 Tax=Vanilla planifolia TaxID=51239 RepID=A0A835QEH4_VANPL|nr:hypothetical protein HPP92_017462 [Vanilla planifolia]